MQTTMLVRSIAIVVLTAGSTASLSGPAVAECTSPVIPMPSFTEMAPTADRILVGIVVEELGLQPGEGPGVTSSFVLEIEEVLRGSPIADVLTIEQWSTGARQVGRCVFPYVYVTVGDRIALAVKGVNPDTGRRGTAAAWIEGRPDAIFAPGAEVLTLSRVRRIAARPPDTSTAISSAVSVPSASVARAVAVSAWKVPLLGRLLGLGIRAVSRR